MSDPTFNSILVRRDTGGAVEDLATLDSVAALDSNGAAVRFVNNSAAVEGSQFVLGRISARRVDTNNVQLDLAVARDPTLNTGDDTPPLLSLASGSGGLSVATATGSALTAGGTLNVSGATALGGLLSVTGAATFNGGLNVNGNVGVTGTIDGRDVSADGTKLDQHLASTANPHNTTAAQVGAPLSLAGVRNAGGDIALVVSGALTISPDDANNRITLGETHSARADNPHATTAAQVGALPIGGGTISGSLAVISTSDLWGSLTVRDNALFQRNLSVVGTGSFSGPLTVNGATTLTGTLAVSGTATLTGTLRANTIGVRTDPGFALDVGDRMRVRQGPAGSAGIWLYQNGPSSDRAFVGMVSDDAVGLWGNTGAGWGLSMNTGNGYVGLGALSPTHRLHVNDFGGLRQNSLYLSGGLGWSSMSYNAHHNTVNTGWVFPTPTRPAVTLEMDDFNGPRFEFFATTTANPTTWRWLMRLDGNSGDLSLGSNLNFGTQVRQMVNLWSTNYGIGVQNWTQYFRTDGNFAWYRGGRHNDNSLNAGGGTVQMVITNDQLGVGTAGPTARLHVAGTAKIDANLGVGAYHPTSIPGWSGGGIICWDLFYGGGTYKYSTVRIKDNIEPLTGALDRIEQLNPVRFDQREAGQLQRDRVGFIAEEVRVVAPECAAGDDDFFAWGVNESAFHALAIAGIQELARKVKRLERRPRRLGRPRARQPRQDTAPAIEVLGERVDAEGTGEHYVTARFRGHHPVYGRIETVRTLRLPPDLPRDQALESERTRWEESI